MKIEDKIILALLNESDIKYYWIGQIISKGSVKVNNKLVLNINPSLSIIKNHSHNKTILLVNNEIYK